MTVTEEAKLMNEAVFNALATPSAEEKAREAVNSFWRSYMYHKFTGMPKRGMMARIMPPLDVKTKAEWLALGIAETDLRQVEHVTYYADVGKPVTLPSDRCVPRWETGQLFYEIAETRLDREDYQRRLGARRVPRYEWQMRESSRRKERSYRRDNPGSRALCDIEDFAYAVMGDLVQQILILANSKETPA